MAIREQNLAYSTEVVEIPTSFDGALPSRGNGLQAEALQQLLLNISSRVADASYKCRVCNQCNIIEECKK